MILRKIPRKIVSVLMTMRASAILVALCLSAPLSRPALGARAETETITILSDAVIQWDRSIVDGTVSGEYQVFRGGQTVQATVDLPALPANQRDARRIVLTVILEPHLVPEGEQVRPGDPWTRLGCVSVLPPAPAPPDRASAPRQPAAQPAPPIEVELLRFITPFGGPATFQQDITALAPLLHGKTTFRLFISTYKKPAWKATVTISFAAQQAGYRRPVWAAPLFHEESVGADKSKLLATISVPTGVARPRLWITSTGHATDGTGGDEFITRTHILRINGKEVARWRPWAESGGGDRQSNPMSGRLTVDGRDLWSSDLDRSGWRPGSVVEPQRIPIVELEPGKSHTVELEIVGIRPKDDKGRGYWRVSAIALADEPWPDQGPPQ